MWERSKEIRQIQNERLVIPFGQFGWPKGRHFSSQLMSARS